MPSTPNPTSPTERGPTTAAARWLPIAAGLVALMIGLALWSHLRDAEITRLVRGAESTAESLERRLESIVAARVRALEVLADPADGGALRSFAEWRRESEDLIATYPALETIEWVDPETGRVEVLAPLAERGEQVLTPAEAERLARAARRAAGERRPVVVGPFEAGNGSTVRILVPVIAAGGSDALLAGRFDAEILFADLREETGPGYWLEIVGEGRRIFAALGTLGVPGTSWRQERRVELPGGAEWTLRLAPTSTLVRAERTFLPQAVLALSILVALLLTVATRFGELARLRAARLEAAVRERTAELEAAKVEAQSANAAKDHFLAMLGHELRNPLGSIFNALEVIDQDEARAPEARRMRDLVQRQMRHLNRLVEDMLDVARIERGKLSVRLEPLDLARLVAATAETERPKLEEAGLAFEVALPAEAVWVEGDATRLEQVVVNLLTNARKFTDPGGRIGLMLESGAEGEASVVVADTGCGMTADELAEVFEPFAQADPARDRMAGGLGLGLPIARGLVDAHGGVIEASSDGPGHGTEVRVRLPRIEAPAGPPDAEPPAEAGGHRRIVVIDDNADVAEALQALLEAHGHRVAVAVDGESGLETIERFGPDLVLCDLGLPGELDGYDVAARLRAQPATADLPLYALSGYGDDASRLRSAEAGFDRHLVKPIEPAKLFALLAAAPVRSPT